MSTWFTRATVSLAEDEDAPCIWIGVGRVMPLAASIFVMGGASLRSAKYVTGGGMGRSSSSVPLGGREGALTVDNDGRIGDGMRRHGRQRVRV